MITMSRISANDVLAMSVSERMKLIQTLWESIADAPESLPVTDKDREEINRRLEAYYRDPKAGSPWPEVLKRLKNGG